MPLKIILPTSIISAHMKDGRNGLPANLSHDGVHPTLEGYKIMEPLAEKAIADALKRK